MKKNFLFLLCLTTIVYSQEFEPLIKMDVTGRVENGAYGLSIAVNENTMIIGMPNDGVDVNGNDYIAQAGSAFVYEKNLDGVWIQTQKIVASDRSFQDYFGSSIDVFGEYAIIGAYFNEAYTSDGTQISGAGAAYVFKKNTLGVWVEIQKLVADNRSSNAVFGSKVLLDGDYAFVSSTGDLYDSSGGNYLLQSGAVYIFKRNADDTWLPFQKLVASDRGTRKWFGISFNKLGSRLGIGSANTDIGLPQSAGAAYIFEQNSDETWTEAQKIVSNDISIGDRFGDAISLSSSRIYVTASGETQDANGSNYLANGGACYIFENLAGAWVQSEKVVPPVRGTGDRFGFSVNSANDYLIIGAPGEAEDTEELNPIAFSGSIYIYKYDNSNQLQFIEKLKAPDKKANAWFGRNITFENNTLAVGAPFDSTDEVNENYLQGAGAAYVSVASNSLNLNTEIADIAIIYPNPTSGRLKINLGELKTTETDITIYNAIGQKIFKKHFGSSNEIVININETPGIYFISIEFDGRRVQKKIIKY